MRPHSSPVLVAEAHDDMLVALELALESEGYAVTAVKSARDALAELERTGRPGLLLLDETLPEPERARLIRFIRQEPTLRSLPIVLLSVSDTLRPPDVQAVLRKPFSLGRLCAVVRAHGAARRASRTRMSAVRPRPAGVPGPAGEEWGPVRLPDALPG